jgi:flagellar basal-body rod modification protein FlgD
VGRDVTLAGNKLALSGGKGAAGFELSGPAERVQVEVLSPSGRVVDTLALGAQGAGRHDFEWQPAQAADSTPDAPYTFRVMATSGATKLSPTLLMRDHIEAVQTGAQGLTLQTGLSGAVAYSDVKAFN